MKKTSKACFILAIIFIAVASILILASCIPCGLHWARTARGFYSIQFSTYFPLAQIRLLTLGCTGIISGLLLFILSAILKLDAFPQARKPKKEAPEKNSGSKSEQKPEQKAEEKQAGTENEAPSQT